MTALLQPSYNPTSAHYFVKGRCTSASQTYMSMSMHHGPSM